MSRVVHRIAVGRVVLRGVAGVRSGRDAGPVREAIALELALALGSASLPEGRTVAAGLRIEAPSLALGRGGPGPIARAVAHAVRRAVEGGRGGHG